MNTGIDQEFKKSGLEVIKRYATSLVICWSEHVLESSTLNLIVEYTTLTKILLVHARATCYLGHSESLTVRRRDIFPES
jgi:hypothetical protein